MEEFIIFLFKALSKKTNLLLALRNQMNYSCSFAIGP